MATILHKVFPFFFATKPNDELKKRDKLPSIPLRSFELKIIALLAMVIDHVGLMFLEHHPLCPILRIIGRMAFPIYAFLIVEGFFHTRNFKAYASSLLLWAFLSEIPYDLAMSSETFNPSSQNVFFTLFLGLIMIKLCSMPLSIAAKVTSIILIGCIAFWSRSDYGIYGIGIILIFYLFRRRHFHYLKLGLFAAAGFFVAPLQALSFYTVFILHRYNGQPGPRIGKYYYSFYAAHLLLFYIIRALTHS
ncbi:MAG TPA: TraX family protein [Sphingobacterium sp.]|nr:TraX family protein [Sphingobacterium sp.]